MFVLMESNIVYKVQLPMIHTAGHLMGVLNSMVECMESRLDGLPISNHCFMHIAHRLVQRTNAWKEGLLEYLWLTICHTAHCRIAHFGWDSEKLH
jgi:hypothetical protein